MKKINEFNNYEVIFTFLLLKVYDGVLSRWSLQDSLSETLATSLEDPSKGLMEEAEDVLVISELYEGACRPVAPLVLQEVSWGHVNCQSVCSLWTLHLFLLIHLGQKYQYALCTALTTTYN